MSQQRVFIKKTGKSGDRDDFINRYVAQVFIFQGEDYLGWDCFYKDRISIGRSRNADVVLRDESISDIQAIVYFKGDQIIVSDQTEGHGVFVNNRPFKTGILGPLDYIDIGNYTIKVKLRKNENRYSDYIENNEAQESGDCTDCGEDIQEGRYRLVCEGEIRESLSIDDVKQKLAGLLKTGKSGIERLLSGRQVTVKKDTDYETAVKLKESLEKAGVVARIESCVEEDPAEAPEENEHKTPDIEDLNPQPEDLPENDAADEETLPRDTLPALVITPYEEDDEDEDEEDHEDLDNLYFLKDRLINAKPVSKGSSEYRPRVLEVLKYRNKVLIDVCFLNANEKYYIGSGKEKFLLAAHNRKKAFYFYFSDQYKGIVRTHGSTITETIHLKSPVKLVNKKKEIYQEALPGSGDVIISDGTYEYLLRQAVEEKSADVIPFPPKKRIFHKFLMKSALVHVVLLILFGLYTLIPDSEDPLPETRFVRIEADELLKLEKKVPPPPKPKPEVPKAQPKEKPQVARVEPEKEVPVKKTQPKPKPRQVVSAKTSKPKPNAQAGVSRHPDAGGGYGKGNVTNRNVNEAGLLSLIGDSVSLKPTSAMAAVTNLDAVPSARGSEGNFKVNGIVGKLGSAKIEVPKSGGIVSTKGSTQVLRSAGAGGTGRVAALEKGKTGQKQVMGMVTAKLTRTVSIRGGMSREAVKRVIDQHLDEISYCYETALIANPSIMGKVTFEWKILMSGRVGEVTIKSSTINSAEIHSCIKSAIKTWQFPKPQGSEVIVSYPFIFDIVGF